jgi:signal transduction histidine kinase
VIAVVASIAALWLAFTLRSGRGSRDTAAKILAAVVMGFAISGMHYTGMAAANYDPNAVCTATTVFNIGNFQLGMLIAVVMLSIISTTLTASMFDARLASRTAEMLASVEAANQDLKLEIKERARIQSELEKEIENRKAAEQKLEAAVVDLYRSNEELEQFAYVASHDLQTPLRAIVSFSQMLEEEVRGKVSPAADEFLDFIHDGGRRMQALIQDLLQLSRIGKEAKPPKKVSIAAVVDVACRQLRADINEKKAQVTTGKLPDVMGNETELAQLFQNLIGNAIKYTTSGTTPEVRITAERKADNWHFVVKDNGIGIPEEYQRTVFVIFRRLHAIDQYPGTGIGLSLCKKIVERHRGEIWVESTPGKGSSFHFTLPAAP